MSKFEVWEAHQEQWDESNIDPPDQVIEAGNPTQAAELFADRHASGGEIAVIVRDEAGNYYEIELVQMWEVDLYKPTTLKELCSP